MPPVMVIAAFCQRCSEIRARSTFTFQRGEAVKSPLKAEDFTPIGAQPQPTDGQPSTCYVCNAPLTLRPFPADVANGSTPTTRGEHYTGDDTARGVEVLFAAQPGEDVKEMRGIGPDKILVITTRRILTVDLTKLVEEL